MLLKILTKNDYRILNGLLSGESSLSGLSRQTGIFKAQMFHYLKDLEKIDLVRKEVQGKNHLHRLNFFHPQFKNLVREILLEKKIFFDEKLAGIPRLIDAFLKTVLKEKYQGGIFFGSSISEKKFKDVDVFIFIKDFEKLSELNRSLKSFAPTIAPIFGTREELENGALNQDRLYLNILEGLPFSCDSFFLETKFKQYFLRKKDVTERFIFGFRELLACKEFTEPEFLGRHLERGVMDIIYAYLTYREIFPKNDAEARKAFKAAISLKIPASLEESLIFAKKIGELI